MEKEKNEEIEKNESEEIEVEYKEESIEEEKEKKDLKDQKNKDLIKQLEEKLEQANEKYLYILAEMKDLHKSYQNDNFRSLSYFKKDFVLELLPIIDIFETVLENKDVPQQVNAYLKGFEIILSQLKQFLELKGVEEIIIKDNSTFDYNLHNAIEKEETQNKKLDEKIKEVIQKGYKIDGKLLRPASVVVYKFVTQEKEDIKKTKKADKEEKKEENKKNEKVMDKQKEKGGDLND